MVDLVGSALGALLADVMPRDGRALLVGVHGTDLIEQVAAGTVETTVLAGSADDATALAKRLVESAAPDVRVVTSLTGTYDLVIAAGGLDRQLGDLDWSQQLETLVQRSTPDAVLLLALENDFSTTSLLDGSRQRDLHLDDPSRPASSAQFIAALARAGLDEIRTYAAIPLGLIDVGVAAATGPGRLPTRLAAQALEAATVDVPLLAPITTGIDAAARAGLLGSIMPAWLAVSRASDARAIYTAVLAADLTDHGWSLQVTAPPTSTDTTQPVVFSSAAVTAEVPDAVSVESVLLRLAATGDVPAFRALAARLGDWVRVDGPLPLWDDVGIDGDVLSPGIGGWVSTEPASTPELLAAAWHRFHDRLITAHSRHPWPPWMIGDDLVTTWLAMSGVEATSSILARGRELATALKPVVPVETPDLRTALADASRSRAEAADLAGHISGLEQTLAFRDRQLAVRENRIRALRAELQKASGEHAKLTADNHRVRNSRTYRLARQLRRASVITKPRRLARAVKRRLRG